VVSARDVVVVRSDPVVDFVVWTLVVDVVGRCGLLVVDLAVVSVVAGIADPAGKNFPDRCQYPTNCLYGPAKILLVHVITKRWFLGLYEPLTGALAPVTALPGLGDPWFMKSLFHAMDNACT
jgi:hypothetical protein